MLSGKIADTKGSPGLALKNDNKAFGLHCQPSYTVQKILWFANCSALMTDGRPEHILMDLTGVCIPIHTSKSMCNMDLHFVQPALYLQLGSH